MDAVFLEGSILLIISNVKHVFMSHLAIFMSPLDIWLFRSPAQLLIGLFSYAELHELHAHFGSESFVSVASFAVVFSHSEGCLFILYMIFFAMQKPLSLIRSHLCIFAFISNILGGGS